MSLRDMRCYNIMAIAIARLKLYVNYKVYCFGGLRLWALNLLLPE